MPPASWSVMPVFAVVTGLSCLAVAIIMWMRIFQQMKRTQRETEQHHQVLAHRLLAIESRMDTLENPGRRAATDNAKPQEHAAPGEMKQVRRAQSLLDVRVDQKERNAPTLIAIPDLGSGEEAIEGHAGNELSERHGEAWRLAAAGVPPEEIARRTGQPIGQIEVIVGLYRRLHSSRGSIDHARSS